MVSHNLFPILYANGDPLTQLYNTWTKNIFYIFEVFLLYIFSINVHVWQSVNEQTIFHRPITEYIFLLSISYIRHGICQRYFFIQSTFFFLFFFYLLFFMVSVIITTFSYIIRTEHQREIIKKKYLRWKKLE